MNMWYLDIGENQLNSESIEKSISFVRKYWTGFYPKLIDFALKLLIAIVVYLIAHKLIQWIMKLVKRSFERTKLEVSVAGFLEGVIKVILNFVLFMIIANILFEGATGTIVAIVGSAGLALGLALQGSLSNFAGGILILFLKPFRVGDYIITNGNEGTVSAIDIFYTKLLTIDNRLIVIPNGTLSNSSIINVTNEPIRRLDLSVSVDYSENIPKVKDILYRLGQEHDMVLHDHEITVFVNSFDPSAINIGLRVWVDKDHYWPLKWDMLEKIKYAFDENHITIPYDQLDVNLSQIVSK